MKILDDYIAATNTHQFEEVKKLLHPNAVYYFSDRSCTTHEEIRAYFENAWSIVENENYEAQDVHWLFVNEQSATCTYMYFFEGYINGEYANGYGRATNVFIKESDKWLLVHEHLSPLPK